MDAFLSLRTRYTRFIVENILKGKLFHVFGVDDCNMSKIVAKDLYAVRLGVDEGKKNWVDWWKSLLSLSQSQADGPRLASALAVPQAAPETADASIKSEEKEGCATQSISTIAQKLSAGKLVIDIVNAPHAVSQDDPALGKMLCGRAVGPHTVCPVPFQQCH